VDSGTAETQYEHRGCGVEDQGHPPEVWDCPAVSGRTPYTESKWRLHVDCSGFIRRVYQTATGAEIMASLSDRRFMRARDFCHFFGGLPSVKLEKDCALLWRLVPDVRMVMQG
jgi:hypothetical protein